MKTKYFNNKISIFSILGMMALLATSCGSYQSTSYHDRDGVYGSSESRTAAQSEPTTRKDYFGAYRIENNDTFTDVENYSTSYAVTPSAVAQEQSAANYGGWGDTTEGVTVNVYGGNWPYWGWNNYWYGSYWGWNSWIGPSWGIGWGYPYYGFYGWGYPYYGWGWNNYYYGGWNHHHHYNHAYSYNGGRRNYYYNNGSRGRNYSTGTRNSTYSTTGTRTYTPRTNTTGTRETTAPRQYNNSNNNPTYSAPRSTAPTRTYSPSSSGTRSSGSSGGGSYGGSSGGSRGGGRR